MSVRKRWNADKTSFKWEFCITIQKIPRIQHRVSGFATKKEAQEAEHEALATKRQGVDIRSESALFSHVMEIFLSHAQKRYSPNTYKQYKNFYNNHLKEFHSIKIKDLTSIVIQNWVDNSLSKISPFVINACLKFCKAAFNYAISHNVLSKNPFTIVRKVEARAKLHNHFNIEEARILLSQCRVYFADFYPILALAMFTGMRTGEILGLKWADIDFKRGKIAIVRQYTKGILKDVKTAGSKRVVDLSPTIVHILQNYKQNCKVLSEFVFINNVGKLIDADNMRDRRFKPLLEACGYPKSYMRFHDLRGTYVDIMMSQGVPIKYIQTQLGHSKISTTLDIYSKLIPEINSHAVNVLENSLNCVSIL